MLGNLFNMGTAEERAYQMGGPHLPQEIHTVYHKKLQQVVQYIVVVQKWRGAVNPNDYAHYYENNQLERSAAVHCCEYTPLLRLCSAFSVYGLGFEKDWIGETSWRR